MRALPSSVSIRRPRPISSSSLRNGSVPSCDRNWCSNTRPSRRWRISSPMAKAGWRMPPAADRDLAVAAALPSLTALLRHRATVQPGDRAYVALSDRGHEDAAITFAELDRRAAALASRLAEHAAPGSRALLLFPMGIECLVAFFGCLYAGLIGVPLMVPRRQSARDASVNILADCSPRLALTPAERLSGVRGDLVGRSHHADLEWLAVDAQP